jgi:adenosylcobinamide kinase / adenosylcobinamide-phosphate guanylyltransferase
MRKLTFVLGGARSGKSGFAQKLASQLAGDHVLFVATLRETPAVLDDVEMRARIVRHQNSRPAGWQTIVLGEDPPGEIQSALGQNMIVLVDCMSLFITQVLFGGERSVNEDALANADVEQIAVDATAQLLTAYQRQSIPWIVVSNEVGMGVVPAYASGRMFRDALGRVNQYVATMADEVLFVVAGLPMRLK